MPWERTLFVHIGTHKTGTTAIQQFIRRNAAILASHDLHVPITGTLDESSGHHNVAWQLLKDKRFHPTYGTLGDLVLELKSIRCSGAILSSEDFEYLVVQPERIAELEHAVNGVGWRVVYILFLRQQEAYIPSLYHELTVHHQLRISFYDFISEILRAGYFQTSDRWCFYFDYARFIATWRAATTSELRVVDYGRACADRGIFSALLAAMRIIDQEQLLVECTDMGIVNSKCALNECSDWLPAVRANRSYFAKLNARLSREHDIILTKEFP